MNTLDLVFLFLVLYNTNMGMSNVSKNDEQRNKLEQIEKKLDKIMEAMGDEPKS